VQVIDQPVSDFERFPIPPVPPGFNFKDAIDGFVKRPSSRRAKRVE
jgi:hypothetical protein